MFGQIRGFGDYGFPESHAASFALLVYVSAWLKCHYPAAFTAALLNSQPMGFYAPAQLVGDARRHGVEVLPVDVNCSEWDCTLEQGRKAEGGRRKGEGGGRRGEGGMLQNANCRLAARRRLPPSPFPLPPSPLSLRLGFNMLLGMSSAHVERIERARHRGPFRSLDDFARRTGLSRAVITRLAKAGTFGSLQLDRRGALWEALGQDQKELPLFDRAEKGGRGKEEGGKQQAKIALPLPLPPSAFRPPPSAPFLPKMSAAEEVLADYRTAGLSLRAHPLQFLRADLEQRRVVTAESLQTLPDGQPVRVAGLVLVRQRPGTAKGITFVTLEDETGTANLIVRLSIWKRYREPRWEPRCSWHTANCNGRAK